MSCHKLQNPSSLDNWHEFTKNLRSKDWQTVKMVVDLLIGHCKLNRRRTVHVPCHCGVLAKTKFLALRSENFRTNKAAPRNGGFN